MTSNHSNSLKGARRSLLVLLLLGFITIVAAGCGSSGGGDFTTSTNPSSNPPPSPGTGDGTLTFLFARTQMIEVPGSTVRIRFEFLNSGQTVLDTKTFNFAPAITVTPPTGTASVRLTALSTEGFPLAESNGVVPVPGPGQNIQVDVSGFLTKLISLDLFSVTPDVVPLAGGAQPGETQQLTLTATFSNGEIIVFSSSALQTAKFSSSLTSVAEVSASGQVTGRDAGTSLITVTYTDPLGQAHTATVEVVVDTSLAEAAATGRWITVVNSGNSPPNDSTVKFFSFNQPSINANGRVVFRARAKGPTGEGGSGGGGEPLSGVWFRDLAGVSNPSIRTMADRVTAVSPPNGNNVTFNEFPSIPRIDFSTGLMGTRGNHQPAETIPLEGGESTKAGTTGLYLFDGLLRTGMSNLGSFAQFSVFQVPGVTPLTKFSVFPGSPSISDGKFVVSKGNFVLDTEEDTCVFFRDISNASNPAVMIASSLDLIPGQSVKFDSTAPPSAAKGKMVFVGLDNEDAPTLGGIYLAPLSSNPTLTPLVEIGDLVTNIQGAPLGDGSTFNAFGEALSFDGRHLAFWAAWGTEKRDIVLTCRDEGNKDIKQFCMETFPDGFATQIPVNQGIFLMDTQTNSLKMVARAGEGEQFEDFLYWVFSGRPPGVGGGEESEEEEPEPPRWRASAFVAVDGARGVLFKGNKTPGEGVPRTGIYKSALTSGNVGPVGKVAEVGDSHGSIDPLAPAGTVVSEIGIEREAIRNGWFTLTAVFEPLVEGEEEEEEGGSGVYATFCPTFADIPTSSPPTP